MWLRARRLWVREPCDLPDAAGHRKRAIWCCDVCGKRWILRYDADRYPYWEQRRLPWPRRPQGGTYRPHPLMVKHTELGL